MNSYERFCFNLLGKRMKAKRDNYAALRNDLISARFKTPFEVYLSTAYISAIIVGLCMAVIIGIITWILQLPNLFTYRVRT
jgi:flagellar protein FlaJ